MYLEYHLRPTWEWLMTVMDSTEAQLRFGCALTSGSNPSHPAHPMHSSLHTRTARSRTESESRSATGTVDSRRRGSDGVSARRDFLSYALSLMRAHNNEHFDSLPSLDVNALKHIAYVFDGLVYYIRSGIDGGDSEAVREGLSIDPWNDQDENENEEQEEENSSQMPMDVDGADDDGHISGKGRKHTFFQRSDSTLFLGCPPPDPFNTCLAESLLLADQPHLLQPASRKEDLFGIPRSASAPLESSTVAGDYSNCNDFESVPTKLGLSTRVVESRRSAVPSSHMSLANVPLPLRQPPPPPPPPPEYEDRENSHLTNDSQRSNSEDGDLRAGTFQTCAAPTRSGFEGQEFAISMTTNNRAASDSGDYDSDVFGNRSLSESSRAPIIVTAPCKKFEGVSPVKSSVIVHAGSIRQPSSSSPELQSSTSSNYLAAPSPAAEVTVSSSNTATCASGATFPRNPNISFGPEISPGMSYSQNRSLLSKGQMFSHDMLLGRWRVALELFSRVFTDDVGAEAGSVIN